MELKHRQCMLHCYGSLTLLHAVQTICPEEGKQCLTVPTSTPQAHCSSSTSSSFDSLHSSCSLGVKPVGSIEWSLNPLQLTVRFYVSNTKSINR